MVQFLCITVKSTAFKPLHIESNLITYITGTDPDQPGQPQGPYIMWMTSVNLDQATQIWSESTQDTCQRGIYYLEGVIYS